jgi:hypothetical protein
MRPAASDILTEASKCQSTGAFCKQKRPSTVLLPDRIDAGEIYLAMG